MACKFVAFGLLTVIITVLSPYKARANPPLPAGYYMKLSPTVSARRHTLYPIRPSAEFMAEADSLVKKQPSWESYYRRAILRYMSGQYAGAAGDLEVSLKAQKSVAAFYLLAASDLSIGSRTWPKIMAAAQGMDKAGTEVTFGFEYGAFISALQGDMDKCMDNLMDYASRAVLSAKNLHNHPLMGQLGHLTASDLEKITGQAGPGKTQKTQKEIALALAAFFAADYERSYALAQTLINQGAGLKKGRYSEGDVAFALYICSAQMLAKTSEMESNSLKFARQTNNSKAALTVLDDTYFVLGQRDKSIAFLDSGIQRESLYKKPGQTNETLVNFLFARAAIHEQMSETNDALKDCLALLKADPKEREARLGVCRYRLLGDDKKGVADDLNKYIANYPDDSEAYFLRAQLFVLEKNYTAAISDLSRAVNSGYHLSKSLRARGACHAALHQAALADSDLALEQKMRDDTFLVRVSIEKAHPRFNEAGQ